MSSWDTESDSNIDKIIKEHDLFLNLGDFESDKAVDKEFDSLVNLAYQVRDTTIAADALQIAADAAAVAAIWTFGFGMAVFTALEAAQAIDRAVISKKSKELITKITTFDDDISSNIKPELRNYISAYKDNNTLIASKAYKGLNVKESRSLLMQFMATVQKKSHKLDATTFRQYAASARIAYNSKEIEAVYDALDELNFSNKTDEDIQKCIKALADFQSLEPDAVKLVWYFSVTLMSYKLKVSNETIRKAAKSAGIPASELNGNAFEVMDAVGKFATIISVGLSIVDGVFQILDIIDVVKQCNVMCDKLNNDFRKAYKDYYNNIKNSSKQYVKAISST